MKKPVSLGLSILELSKILMYEFLYGYVKIEYDEKVELCIWTLYYSIYKNK